MGQLSSGRGVGFTVGLNHTWRSTCSLLRQQALNRWPGTTGLIRSAAFMRGLCKVCLAYELTAVGHRGRSRARAYQDSRQESMFVSGTSQKLKPQCPVQKLRHHEWLPPANPMTGKEAAHLTQFVVETPFWRQPKLEGHRSCRTIRLKP